MNNTMEITNCNPSELTYITLRNKIFLGTRKEKKYYFLFVGGDRGGAWLLVTESVSNASPAWRMHQLVPLERLLLELQQNMPRWGNDMADCEVSLGVDDFLLVQCFYTYRIFAYL